MNPAWNSGRASQHSAGSISRYRIAYFFLSASSVIAQLPNRASSSEKYRRNSRGSSSLNFGAVLCPRAGITGAAAIIVRDVWVVGGIGAGFVIWGRGTGTIGRGAGTVGTGTGLVVMSAGVADDEVEFDGKVDGIADVGMSDEVRVSVVMDDVRLVKDDEVAVNESIGNEGRRMKRSWISSSEIGTVRGEVCRTTAAISSWSVR